MKILFFCLLLFPQILCAQLIDSLQVRQILIKENDTIVLSNIHEVEILTFKNISDQRYYNRLKIKTLKVYPYAKLAARKLDSIYNDLENISKRRKKKRYIKAIEKWLKNDLAQELKKLSRWEGRILSKLIYRETQISSYEIVKNLKGNMHAFFWQGMAKIYDNNLKTPYRPLTNNEDKMIEHIILQAQLEGHIK